MMAHPSPGGWGVPECEVTDMKEKFNVTGMTCSACSAHVEKAVRKLPGVKDVAVSLMTNSMTVEYDQDALNEDGIVAAVEHAGYGAAPAERAGKPARAAAPAPGHSPLEEELRGMKRRFVTSLCFLVPLVYLSMGHMVGLPVPAVFLGRENALILALAQFLLTLPILYINDKYYKVGFKALIHGGPNMDTLIAVGSAAAMVYGVFVLFQLGYGLGHGDWARVEEYRMELYFESAGMILTLITLGKFLETRSRGKTSQAISKLMDLAPKTATVLRDGKEAEVPVEDINRGDLLLVRPGQSVPVDGVIVRGSSALDESAITGESIPVEKGEGDQVVAATMNRTGTFTFRATRVGEDTTLAQIIRLVEEASSSKAPIAKLADRVAGVFVPVVMAIAAVTFVVWMLAGAEFSFALTAGVSVLVISCPCALGLATPVAIMAGTGKGAEYGILVKSAQALETIHSVKTVVLDKTGTITQGAPQVTDVYPFGRTTAEELLCAAASLERLSEHPLAAAVVTEAERRSIPLCPVENFQAIPGKGIRGEIQGSRFLAGNAALLREEGVDPGQNGMIADTLAAQGKTPLFFAQDGALIGILAAADVVKPTSRAAVAALQEMGIRVVMLTGDNQRTADAVGRQVGVDRVVAQVLPQDKARVVAQLQKEGGRVAMVGDGINDAPALATADVGLAIGAGTDVAIESADIVLMKSDLMDVVTAVELSRATLRNIKENLFWAFFYNTIGIPLAAGVFYPLLQWQLSPMFAAAAMSLSSVCVVTNALRLRLFKPRHAAPAKESRELPGTQEEPAAPAGSAAPRPAQEDHKKQDEGGTLTMNKTLTIEGMMCAHCTAHVQKALSAVPGVSGVEVSLEGKSAAVTLSAPVEDQTLKDAVTEAGYEVVEIR